MRRIPLVLAIATLIAACDDGPVDPLRRVEPVPAGIFISILAGPAGGNHTFMAGDATFGLQIPPGALADTVTITVRTQEATKEQRFQLVLSPGGLLFAQPVTISVLLGDDDALAPTGTLLYDAVPLAPLPGAPGFLVARIRGFASEQLFGFGAGFRATPPDMPNTSPLPPPCMADFSVDEFVPGALTAADEVYMGLYRLCADMALHRTSLTGDVGSARRLADATDAYVRRVETGGNQETLAFEQFRTASCARLDDMETQLQDSAITAFGQLPRMVNRVRFLAQHVQRVGVACPDIDTYVATIDARITQASGFYTSRVGQVASTTSPEYELAVQEAARFERSIAELRALGASQRMLAHATAVARDRLHPAIVDVLLPAASAACEAGNTAPLMRLLVIMGPRAALLTALQGCTAGD